MFTPLLPNEVLAIAASLEDYHAVFYRFMEMSAIGYEDAVPTAAVRFTPNAKPEILLNRAFWGKLNHRERLFVICHECLHVLLRHDSRNGADVPGATPKLVNQAQDITINEMIVHLFKFNRDDLREWRKYCWIDTCFKDPSVVLRNETFDYYLRLLLTDAKDELPDLLDDHSAQGDGGGTDPGQAASCQRVSERLADTLTPEELNSMSCQLPGNATGAFDAVLAAKGKPLKLNLQRLIRKLKRTRLVPKAEEVETFSAEGRRFMDLARRSDVTLPGSRETERPSKDRLLTALFMDISGSCVAAYPEFCRVVEAFNAERDMFEIHAFTFDVKVRPVKLGDRVRPGGGTRFDIVAAQVEALRAEFGRHPDCVVVVSDGDGSQFSTPIPSRWIWLLTDNPVYRYIPAASRRYALKDVTF